MLINLSNHVVLRPHTNHYKLKAYSGLCRSNTAPTWPSSLDKTKSSHQRVLLTCCFFLCRWQTQFRTHLPPFICIFSFRFEACSILYCDYYWYIYIVVSSRQLFHLYYEVEQYNLILVVLLCTETHEWGKCHWHITPKNEVRAVNQNCLNECVSQKCPTYFVVIVITSLVLLYVRLRLIFIM